MSDWTIEAVTDLEAAWDELRPLMRAQIDLHAGFFGRPVMDDWEPRLHDHFPFHDEAFVLVARAGAAPIGYINGWINRYPYVFDEAFGYIQNAYVVPEWRGRGVGRAMLDEAEAWVRARGLSEVRLLVAASNDLGITVWEHTGFRPHMITMSKTLEESRNA